MEGTREGISKARWMEVVGEEEQRGKTLGGEMGENRGKLEGERKGSVRSHRWKSGSRDKELAKNIEETEVIEERVEREESGGESGRNDIRREVGAQGEDSETREK